MIWLRNETIYFNVKGGLTIADVTVLGGDMHAENVGCSDRTYNVNNLCTCYASITTMDDSQLYNASSKCSVMRDYVAVFTGVYPGFFQICISSLKKKKNYLSYLFHKINLLKTFPFLTYS